MTDFERINGPRVDKIMGMLEVIEKSAKSQRVDNAEHDQLLDPIRRSLGAIEPKPQAEVAVKENAALQKPASKLTGWDIRTVAQEASLDDLTFAMAVYLNRIDEHLSNNP